MSFPQLSYPTPISTAPNMSTSQLLSTPPSTTVSTSCCENGRPVMTDPHTGQTVCSCRYSSTLLSASYPAAARVPGLESVYNSAAYASQGYGAFAADPSAFYSPLNSAYGLKDNIEAWRTLSQSASAACYPYDTTGMTTAYPYMNSYGPMDLNGARRKNATRESTSTLKAWLQEHIKNPYPTKGEKIMLAIITKMTLTQVSTWFANARRRLKKENKMTWSPKNRCDDDDDDASIKSDDDLDDVVGEKKKTDIKVCSALGSPRNDDGARSESDNQSEDRSPSVLSSDLIDRNGNLGQFQSPSNSFKTQSSDNLSDEKMQSKPKIWSLAQTATSKSPPLGRRSPINLSQSIASSRPSTFTSSIDVPSLWGKSPLYSSINYPSGFSRYPLGSMPYPTPSKPTIGGSDLSQPSLSSRTSDSQVSSLDSLVHPAFGAFRPVEKINQLAK